MRNRKESIENILASFHSIKNKIMVESLKSLKEIDITPAQGQILMVVKHHGSVSQKEIADHMGISPSAVTQLIESLVANDYLIREVSQEDKRVWNIQLSEKSKSKMTALRSGSLSKLANIFEVLDDTELGILDKMFAKISSKIISDRKEE